MAIEGRYCGNTDYSCGFFLMKPTVLCAEYIAEPFSVGPSAIVEIALKALACIAFVFSLILFIPGLVISALDCILCCNEYLDQGL